MAINSNFKTRIFDLIFKIILAEIPFEITDALLIVRRKFRLELIFPRKISIVCVDVGQAYGTKIQFTKGGNGNNNSSKNFHIFPIFNLPS